MTDCTQLDPLIAERASGSLDAGDAGRLDAHLAGCARCRAELAAWEETFGLARLPAPSDAERHAVVAHLPVRVRAELRRAPFAALAWRLLAIGFAAAAVVVVVANKVVLPSASHRAGSTVTAAAWQEPDPDALLQKVVKEHAELAVATENGLSRAEELADAAYLRAINGE
jgi:anti-sigma factor RsiW